MSVDISGFEDVSKERKSKVWINMLFHKQKGLALCKICLEKQFTRIVYAKNGSTNLSNTYIFEYRSTFYNNTVWVQSCLYRKVRTQYHDVFNVYHVTGFNTKLLRVLKFNTEVISFFYREKQKNATSSFCSLDDF